MPNHILDGINVVEIADQRAEYVGLILAGLGANVIKVEPPAGSPTRDIGPFFEDVRDRDRSLHFWTYNRGKRSIVVDLESDAGRETLDQLISQADVLIDSTPRDYLKSIGLARNLLMKNHPGLVISRVTDFGDDGPWSEFRASDLIHLALGGQMMNTGYSPRPDGTYDEPPIAGQAWHSYHIAGEQVAFSTIAALYYRDMTGIGQQLTCAIHEAVAKNTELDVSCWIYGRAPISRQTCAHAAQRISQVPPIVHTKDGRWFMLMTGRATQNLQSFAEQYGVTSKFLDEDSIPEYGGRTIPGSTSPKDPGSMSNRQIHMIEVMQRVIGQFTYEEAPWHEAQEAGLLFAPLRAPEENLEDEHWKVRGTFSEIHHPEHQQAFSYVTSKWISSETSWKSGRRAPLLNEDEAAVLTELSRGGVAKTNAEKVAASPRRNSVRGKPLALDGIRIFDFSWFLASAGGTRFLASMGAEVIKVEWALHPDTRMGAMAPVGGREARRTATAPLEPVSDRDMGGQFNNKNSGKRGISLNVAHPDGMAIARRLVAISDVVAEGFSPGVMDRWGLGYEALQAIRSDIIYVQQSGMGSHGTYGRFRAVGPIAGSLAGINEMSGLPNPAMPAGWGYSYLDWIGAYSFALSIMSALYYRQRTGLGQWIDASQTETGIFISGVPILDYSANERHWQRSGNRSPWLEAAPHGAYRCAGHDRWIAIACFNEEDWQALTKLAHRPEWSSDQRFSNLEARLRHQNELDQLIDAWTRDQDRYELMLRLQNAGITAGVCQTGEDKVDVDPQLAALEWLVEVTGTKIGTWPIPEAPVKMSETPTYIGGMHDRSAPCYGEDNEYVLGELLGYDSVSIARLAEDGVI